MKKEEKQKIIDSLKVDISNSNHFYLTDISGFDVEVTSKLRRLCFRKDIKLRVVKNTLFINALENSENDYSELYDILKGSTSVMFTDTGNAPAKLIKEFIKKEKQKKPIIKGAYVEECFYKGEDQLDVLANIKSKNELIGEVIGILQSPAKNVVSALQSGGNTIAGVIKTLSEKSE